MKYYLLIFNEDYADEHNVPAIACMTEEKYQKWLKTPSGELNENYESEMKIYNEELEKYNNLIKQYQDKGIYNKSWSKFTEEELEWGHENPLEFSYDEPKKVTSNLNARLGNNGDFFEEDYEHLYLMEEFVDANLVKVTEVNEDFYNTFNKVNLSQINLCNIFDF
jgi:hypothetical protein